MKNIPLSSTVPNATATVSGPLEVAALLLITRAVLILATSAPGLISLILVLLFGGSLFLEAQQPYGTKLSFTQQGKTTRALVVGVSSYRDTLLQPQPSARQDAELFAALLRSRSGGLLPGDNIKLLTGQQATFAQFTTYLNWLSEENRPGDRINIFLSMQVKLLPVETGVKPYLLFHDSPPAPAEAGAMSLSVLCSLIQQTCIKRSLHYTLFLDLDVLPSPAAESDSWSDWLQALQRSFPVAFSEEAAASRRKSDKGLSTFSKILQDGLLGLADRDINGWVYPEEAGWFLKKNRRSAQGGSSFLLAFSAEENIVSGVVQERQLEEKVAKNESKLFPSLVNLEISRLEDSLISRAGEQTRQWYEDFIITIKLGNLMEPPGRNAADLYDSLIHQSSIQPLHSHLRRQLAAALQDETQQAINAYLRTETRELFKRGKDTDHYKIYPKYLELTTRLLGPQHFMYSLIRVKQLYFEGLALRLDYNKLKDSSLLKIAIEKQYEALSLEPEAAFVYNELGVLYSIMKSDSALACFEYAIQLAPQWSLPYSNLCIIYREKGDYDKALSYGEEAIRLAPWNSIAINNLGEVYLKMKSYQEAEFKFREALSLDIEFEGVYYNLSCVKALQGQTSAALQWLEIAFEKGYDDKDNIRKDEDLISIKDTPEFQVLLRKYLADR